MGPFVASDTGYAGAAIGTSQTRAPLTRPDGTNLPGVPATRYRILALFAMPGGTATNVTLVSVGGNRSMLPLLACAANSPTILPYNPYGWCETDIGETVGITTGSGSAVAVQVVYGIVNIPP